MVPPVTLPCQAVFLSKKISSRRSAACSHTKCMPRKYRYPMVCFLLPPTSHLHHAQREFIAGREQRRGGITFLEELRPAQPVVREPAATAAAAQACRAQVSHRHDEFVARHFFPPLALTAF